jgi:hypothetical protein
MNEDIDYRHVEATYKDVGGRRFAGNPFVEALPLVHWTKDDLLNSLKFLPPRPTDADRQQSELVRAGDLHVVNDIVYPRPAYREAAFAIVLNLMESYVHRNPLAPDDMRRRHQLANVTQEQLDKFDSMSSSDRFSMGWRRTAPGYGLFGATGTGKSTLLNALMQQFAVVIQHRTYRGSPIVQVQIPVIRIQVPFDATLRTFCRQFFRQVDKALGRELYESQSIKRNHTVGSMVLQLFKVCSAVSLGMLVVDDVQNLRAARGANLEIALNLFSLLMEIAGVAVVISGTPAFGALIDANSRNIRKLMSGGSRTLGMMMKASKELDAFQKAYIPYQYTKQVAQLDDFSDAWFMAGAGNPAFMSLAFMVAQRHAIGGKEALSIAEFERALNVEMASLKPAIQALRDNDLMSLKRFEDLIFRDELRELLRNAGISRSPTPPDNEELDDENDPPPSKRPRNSAKKSKGKNVSSTKDDPRQANPERDPLPTENAVDLQDLG